jgi:hypothetical protein
MEFSAFRFMVIRELRTGMIAFDIDLEISVGGLDQESDCCQCSLYLVQVQGIFYPCVLPDIIVMLID